MKRALFAITAALLLAGCGEITNTIVPRKDTANHITVALYGPTLDQLGIAKAQSAGFFSQADLDVHFIQVDSTDTGVSMLVHNEVELAIVNEPAVMLARNADHPLVSVAAIVQSPSLPSSDCSKPKRRKAKPRCRATTVPALAPYKNAGSYDGLVFALMENTIVNHTAIPRRFLQAVARGYNAIRNNPPNTVGIQQALGTWFSPSGEWGLQAANDWNAFGTYLINHHEITNPNATPAASTNELLAGQGV
jgi:ABC-type nitrate/sulfonate/bicarbonate transport system substrate-binding protein